MPIVCFVQWGNANGLFCLVGQ